MKTIRLAGARKTYKKMHIIQDVVIGSGLLLFGILLGLFLSANQNSLTMGLIAVTVVGAVALLLGMRIKDSFLHRMLTQVNVIVETSGSYYFEGVRYKKVHLTLEKEDVVIVLSEELV